MTLGQTISMYSLSEIQNLLQIVSTKLANGIEEVLLYKLNNLKLNNLETNTNTF